MDKTVEFSWGNRDFSEKIAQSNTLIKEQENVLFTELFANEELPFNDQHTHRVLQKSIVSIKDLFNVKGYKTRAGSAFLNASEPAEIDAEAVKRLRDSGAYLIGHTNMTELAYSGLGINPHFGTPKTPLYEGCIAGGSTSGGAVSVATGIADIALGTDTGGSLRIPAAFCGVTGFKPSQDSISRVGCLPLSTSLDSVGPIAKTVSECEAAWNVMSGNDVINPVAKRAKFVIPSNFGLDLLDEEVEHAFTDLVEKLKNVPGICVEQRALPFLEAYKELPLWQFSAYEAMRYYQDKYQLSLDELDPKVASRMKRAETIDVKQYLHTCELRDALIERYREEEGNCFLLQPTVAVLPPKLEALEQEAEYDRVNLLCLRNTSLANVLDGCSVSLPYEHQGNYIGVMLTGAKHTDQSLLSLSKLLEGVILKSAS